LARSVEIVSEEDAVAGVLDEAGCGALFVRTLIIETISSCDSSSNI
jgi:hypothetical protein